VLPPSLFCSYLSPGGSHNLVLFDTSVDQLDSADTDVDYKGSSEGRGG